MGKLKIVRLAGMIGGFAAAIGLALQSDYLNAIGVATAALSSTGIIKPT